MSVLRTIIAWLSRWIDDVAALLARLGAMASLGRKVQLVEQPDGGFVLFPVRRGVVGTPVGAPLKIEDGAFVGSGAARTTAMLSGGEVEIVLDASRFVFRPLELPSRAAAFLDGVVRAQIDRLTPWSQRDAAFGWSAPKPAGADKIVVTVGATAAAAIAPIVQAAARRRAASILVSTIGPDLAAPIVVSSTRSAARGRRPRIFLIAGLILAGGAAAAAAGASFVLGDDLDAQRSALEATIASRRAALLSGHGSAADQAAAALDEKKRSTPSAVIALDALSRLLPDDTSLDELRIEDGKVSIAGLTRDAAALIQLIEKSGRFTRATFSAPTTRAPTDSGEHFHIEAHIEPQFASTQ